MYKGEGWVVLSYYFLALQVQRKEVTGTDKRKKASKSKVNEM